MLPDESVIPEWRRFGYGAETVKSKQPPKSKSKDEQPKSKETETKFRKGGHVMKRKMRKFEEGGMTDDTEDMPGMTRYTGGKSGMSMSSRRASSEDEPMTFKQAFAKARANKQSTFTFKNPKTGKMESFHTRTEDEESKPATTSKSEAPYKPSTSVSSGSKKELDDIKLPYKFKEEVEYKASTPRSGGRGSKPGSARVGSGRYDDPSSSYMDRVLSPFKRLTGGNLFGQREVERVSRGAGVGTEEARRRLREAGMSGGGRVKKYAGGGSVHSSASRRADGIAKKGKTRGRIV
jgi:hypothetical protein